MFTALFSFLGGSAFRLIFGEVFSYLNKKQDHSQELERMNVQGTLDAAQHERNMTAIKVQAELGVKTIQVQAEAAIGQVEAEGWLSAVNATAKTIGIAWVDAWNAVIRPGAATWAILMLTLVEVGAIGAMSENTSAICGAALGIYLADRSLFKRGK